MTLKKNKFIKFALCAAVALLTADFSSVFAGITEAGHPAAVLKEIQAQQKELARQSEILKNESEARKILNAGAGYAELQRDAEAHEAAQAAAPESVS